MAAIHQIFIIDLFTFLDQGEDDVSLTPETDFLFDELHDHGPTVFESMYGLNGLAARWHLVHHTEIQVAISRHSQRSWDRCSRHHQYMWGDHSLLPEPGPLCHPKSMLLIDDSQTQIPELHLLFDQGMGADQHLQGTVSRPLEDRLSGCRFGGPGEQ